MRLRFPVLLAAIALLGAGLAPAATAAQPLPATLLPQAREWAVTSPSGVSMSGDTTDGSLITAVKTVG